MPRNKGRFVSQKVSERSAKSSARLKEWHMRQQPPDSDREIENICSNSDDIVSDVPTVAGEVTINPNSESNLPSGRSIVELNLISEQLKSCVDCHSELNLINTVKEDRYGFGSVLTVVCRNCRTMNKIDTNKRHRHEGCERGPKSFVINTKAAIGMYL